MPYQARFFWTQDTDYPIYADLIRPAYNDGLKNGNTGPFKINSQGLAEAESTDISLDLNIVEDFTYELKSSFQNYGEALGGLHSFISTILGYVETMGTLSAMGGQSANNDWMRFQIWKETEPFKMSFKFTLATQSNPFLDVYVPAMALTSMSILSPVKRGDSSIFFTPGVNGSAMKSLQPQKGNTNPSGSGGKAVESSSETFNKEWLKTSKIIREFIIYSRKIDSATSSSISTSTGKSSSKSGIIPLIVVRDCFLESVKPTWSKDRTASGVPIWCELEVSIQSIFSANDSMISYLTPSGGSSNIVGKVATNIFR